MTVKVAKGQLKARMLEYFRKVEETGEELIVTDHRKPVLRVSPYTEKRPLDDVFADVRGHLTAKEPLDAPLTEEWGDLA
jgi:antitoxin (DNA-binding transcriptional repressor) of toxin-antitoxin stability system